MTIQELMEMCVEPGLCKVTIYDSEKSEDVWTGDAEEIPQEYGDQEFSSFDVPQDGHMTFNLA